MLSVALKEAREESGIQAIKPLNEKIFDIDIHLIPANSKEKAHYHYDVRFLLSVVSNEEVNISDESHSLMWISKYSNEFPSTKRSATRLFDKWLSL